MDEEKLTSSARDHRNLIQWNRSTNCPSNIDTEDIVSRQELGWAMRHLHRVLVLVYLQRQTSSKTGEVIETVGQAIRVSITSDRHC